MMLLLLLGCPKPVKDEPVVMIKATEGVEAPPVVPAGTVRNGEYIDADWPIRVRVPDGWTATPGPKDGALRLRLDEPKSKAALEVSAYTDGAVGPRPREGCAWTFETLGHFRAVRVADPVVVATCTPDDPLAARVLGYYFQRGTTIYALESLLPAGQLVAGKSLTDDAIGGVHFALSDAGR